MKRIFALFALLAILSLCILGCNKDEKPQEPPKEHVIITLDEALSSGGLMVGEISLKDVTGEYTLYYGDENGVPLEGYTKIGVFDDTAPFKLEKGIIPPDGKTVVAKSAEATYFAKIPDTCLLSKDDAYVFGALSDVHFGRYEDLSEDAAIIAFDRALDYYEKIGVQMVGIAGDLTSDGEVESLVKYNEAIESRPFPVFSVTGNHDYNAYCDGTWQEYISANLEDCEFAPNGLDFIYAPEEMGGDVFVFFNITYYSYSYFEKTAPVVSLFDQIPWLESVLKAHTENRVYIFFHLFMCGPDGQGHTGVGNIMNSAGYTYTLPFNRGNSDERKMRAWFKKYKNVVYLNGHSHWAFEMERYNEHANYSNFDGEFCDIVHIPSVTEPRWVEDNDTERTGKTGELSQGWIFYDYGDTTILVPIDFISGTIYTEYMEILKN